MSEIERRFSATGVSARADGDKKTIQGYAAVFYREGDPGTEYQLWSDAVERIMPGAFDDVLARDEDTVGLFNHNFDNLLGRTTSGTLRLSVDDVGLAYEIDTADTRVHQDVLSFLDRGEVSGSSFQFIARGEGASVWSIDPDAEEFREIREVRKVSRLIDVGPVVMPAYTGTTAGARACGELEEVRAERDAWRNSIEREKRKRESILRKIQIESLT